MFVCQLVCLLGGSLFLVFCLFFTDGLKLFLVFKRAIYGEYSLPSERYFKVDALARQIV